MNMSLFCVQWEAFVAVVYAGATTEVCDPFRETLVRLRCLGFYHHVTGPSPASHIEATIE